MSRMERINSQVQREIGTIFQQDLSDPAFRLVTITHVNVSRDLRSAKVYFSVLGSAQSLKLIAGKIDRVRGFVRKLVGQRMTIRNTPELFFVYDDSILTGARIEKTLEELKDESEDNSQEY